MLFSFVFILFIFWMVSEQLKQINKCSVWFAKKVNIVEVVKKKCMKRRFFEMMIRGRWSCSGSDGHSHNSTRGPRVIHVSISPRLYAEETTWCNALRLRRKIDATLVRRPCMSLSLFPVKPRRKSNPPCTHISVQLQRQSELSALLHCFK